MKAFAEQTEAIEVSGPCGVLAGLYTGAKPEGALSDANLMAVVCHPHPLHGGTMNNKVVTTLVRTYRDLGVPCVSFNFRGVGQSAGVFDNGVGEVDDLIAVVKWLASHFPSRGLLLAGFSFGSAIAAQGSYRVASLAHLTLVAPPIERYQYDREKLFPAPVCVIQGGKDELVDVAGVYAWAKTLTGMVDVLKFDDTSHFFHGVLVSLKSELTRILLARL